MRFRVYKQAAAHVHRYSPRLYLRKCLDAYLDGLDMSLSKDLTDQFKDRMQQSHDDMDINFSIMVLGTNFWPLNAPNNDFVIPADIQPTHDRFQKYYQVKHSGRKLTWLWNYSKNELRTNYLNQKYILMTSSYQMAV